MLLRCTLLQPRTGRRVVATGGAARPQCGRTRNPWKADEEKGVGVFFPFFAPAGRRRFLSEADERTLMRGDSPAPSGRVCDNTIPPTGSAPPAMQRPVFTRGYNTPPRWGENGRYKDVGCVLRTHADYSRGWRGLEQRQGACKARTLRGLCVRSPALPLFRFSLCTLDSRSRFPVPESRFPAVGRRLPFWQFPRPSPLSLPASGGSLVPVPCSRFPLFPPVCCRRQGPMTKDQ